MLIPAVLPKRNMPALNEFVGKANARPVVLGDVTYDAGTLRFSRFVGQKGLRALPEGHAYGTTAKAGTVAVALPVDQVGKRVKQDGAGDSLRFWGDLEFLPHDGQPAEAADFAELFALVEPE